MTDLPFPPLAVRNRVDADAGHFRRVGRAYVRHLVERAGLLPGHRALDIGCGCGRVAIPLLDYLKGGSYEGFDVDAGMVAWCSREITGRNPRFRFRHVDVRNGVYHPRGERPKSFRFPYGDGEFDVVFAVSVFTHLTRAGAERYLSEAARVLRPGGRALLTFFLLSRDAAGDVVIPRARLHFRHKLRGCYSTDSTRPEAAVAFLGRDVRGMLARAGLSVVEPIRLGRWRAAGGETPLEKIDGEPGLMWQDVIVAERPAA